jgi:hypothetical protein
MDMVMVMVMMLVMNDIDLLWWRRRRRRRMLLSLWNMYHLGVKIRHDWLLRNVWKKGVHTFALVIQEARVG